MLEKMVVTVSGGKRPLVRFSWSTRKWKTCGIF
jgi:hypothetical protein